MIDQTKNFAYGYITANVGVSDTTFSVRSGEGARFPATTGGLYNVVVYNPSYTDASTAFHRGQCEIVRVLDVSTDTFTVVRAQEDTTAIAWQSGWKVFITITQHIISQIFDGGGSGGAGALSGSVSSSATSFSVGSGQGSLYPSTSGGNKYNLTIWDSQYATAKDAWDANRAEIILVNTRSGDNFSSIERAQAGTTAIDWNISWWVNGGGYSSTHFGDGAPSTLYNNGDNYFDRTDTYAMYKQIAWAWVKIYPTGIPAAPQITNSNFTVIYGETIDWTGGADTFTVQISDTFDFSNIIAEETLILGNSYDTTQFFLDNTILGIGGSTSIDVIIDNVGQPSGGARLYTAGVVHDIAWLRDSQISINNFEDNGGYKAPLEVALSTKIFFARVKGYLGYVGSNWSDTYHFRALFAQSQMTVLGCIDDGSTSVGFNTDYGQAYHITSGSGVDRSWGYYQINRDGGLFPDHTTAAFKTISISVPMLP